MRIFEVIRNLKEDEVILVSVSGGALTPLSVEAIEDFIAACRNPSGKPGALLLEAEPLDDFRPENPISIGVSVAKRADVAKGIAIKDNG